MSNCIIVGGSNGIGAAFAEQLEKKYKKIYIFDKAKPIINNPNIEFIKIDLSKDSLEQYSNIINSCNTLIITAGFGRVDFFNNINIPEIDKIIKVNLISTINLIKLFFSNLEGNQKVHCLVMGSLAGELSSPLFSVYSATKAGVNRFIESINIELEKQGSNNRILNVMPISFNGSSFTGKKTNLDSLRKLANDCLERMYNQETIFIPDYEKTCKSILERYRKNPHSFGLSSYDYKMNNNRINNKRQYTIGYLSGTFDLFHIGHLNLLRRAKEQCDYLIVGIHRDASHKGKQTFISFEERRAIVESCKYVDRVVTSEPEDSDAWEKYHYDKLFVGSDYKNTERFNRYEAFFKDKQVEIIYFPYTKGTSSTQLRNALTEISKRKK